MNAAGAIACWAAVRLAEFQDCGFVLGVEVDNVVITTPEQARDICRATVSQPNPDELRWRTSQQRQAVKVDVFADDDATMLTSELANRHVRRSSVAEQSNMKGIRKQVGRQVTQLLGERLIEEEPGHPTQPVCLGCASRAQQRRLGKLECPRE